MLDLTKKPFTQTKMRPAFSELAVNKQTPNQKKLFENTGIVVKSPNIDEDQTIYSIYPFCTDEDEPYELLLRTSEHLYLGDWIKFSNDRSSQLITEYSPCCPSFSTMPCLKHVLVECDIVLPVNMTEQICTKYRKLVSKEVFNQRKTPPFIKVIRDPYDISKKAISKIKNFNDGYARIRGGTLEYCRDGQNPIERGYWRILHIKYKIPVS